MSDQGSLDPRVAELLSARLDGALDAEEAAAADAWLARSPAAQSEWAALSAVKSAVANLPPVDPPDGFFEAMLERGSPVVGPGVVHLSSRRRFRPAAWLGAVAAAAAAWIVVAGSAPDVVSPPLDAVEDAADEAAVVALRPDTRFEADGEPVAVEHFGRTVAIAVQDGRPAWDDLPRGVRAVHRGDDTWVDTTTAPGFARVVVDRDGAVYTLASEELGPDDLLDLAVALPAGHRDDGIVGRARQACDRLLDAVGLD